MSVVVVATITPKAGRLQDVIDAFTVVSPKVHEERGCELYALHTNDEIIVMVERWSSQEDLDAHSSGAAIQELNRLNADALATPTEVTVLRNVPMGNRSKGTIQ